MTDCTGQGVMDFSPAHKKNQLTSKLADDNITSSGLKATHTQFVYTALRNHCNGGTFREIARHIPEIEPVAVMRRLNDLVEHELIRKGTPRKCKVSGRNCFTWWII
ncbi:MAG TPA: hypothetical protein ENH82_13540 [bacterium]|nr:hypothetical protein [bacterium]